MVERVKPKSLLDLPPAERPLDFQHISYVKIENRTEASTEISVKLTAYFGKRNGSEFNGKIHYEYKKEECGICESESFLEAGRDMWTFYRRRGPEVVDFIQRFLTEKWNSLDGEKQTGKKLHLDQNSDDIICDNRPKKSNRSKR